MRSETPTVALLPAFVGPALIAVYLLTMQGPSDGCFRPLANPNSKVTADWSELVSYSPPLALNLPPEVVEVLKIKENGYGPRINLDYYSITFTKHPTLSPSAFFLQMRLAFSSFVAGSTFENRFLPYEDSAQPNDPVRKRNDEAWHTAEPLGAVMSFVLKSIGLSYTNSLLYFVAEQGDVIVGCSTPTDFIFTTLKTKANGYHPVAGNRGFGLKDNGDSTWTFYTKGADREVAVYGTRKASNFIAKKDVDAADSEEAVFILGHRFWLRFFPEVITYLEKQNMKVIQGAFIKNNSHRYPYPLTAPEALAAAPVLRARRYPQPPTASAGVNRPSDR